MGNKFSIVRNLSQKEQMLNSMELKDGDNDEPKGPVKKNDIRDIRNRKQLARVNLDLDSPRMK